MISLIKFLLVSCKILDFKGCTVHCHFDLNINDHAQKCSTSLCYISLWMLNYMYFNIYADDSLVKLAFLLSFRRGGLLKMLLFEEGFITYIETKNNFFKRCEEILLPC